MKKNINKKELMRNVSESLVPIIANNIIIEKYGLSYIFSRLNESIESQIDGTSYKSICANTLADAEDKFGESVAKSFADRIKAAAKFSKKAVYAAILACAMLTGTIDKAEAQTIVSNDVDKTEIIQDINSTMKEMKPEKKGTIFTIDWVDAKFPSAAGVQDWFKKHTHYPYECEQEGIQGRVFVCWTVGTDGKVKDAYILRSPHEALSKEVLRVVNAMPRWVPAKKNGRTVEQRFTAPVTFGLTK